MMNDSKLIQYLQTVSNARLFYSSPGEPYYTPAGLLELGIAVCSCCGKMKPRERMNCIACDEIHFWLRKPDEEKAGKVIIKHPKTGRRITKTMEV